MKVTIANLLQKIIKSKSEKEHLFKVILPSFLIHFFAAILAFVLMFAMTRTLGARQYGIFTYCFSIVFVLVALFTSGIKILTIREVPSILAQGNIGLWRGFSKWSTKIVLIISFTLFVISIALVVICAYFFHILKVTTYTKPLLFAFTALPFCSLMGYYSAALRGQNKPVLSLLPDNIVKPAAFLISFSVLYFVSGVVRLRYAILINTFSFCIGFLFAYFGYKRSVKSIKVTPQYDVKKWMTLLWPLSLLTVLSSINSRLDILVLGAIKGASQVGIYSTADRIAEALTVFLTVMNIITSATISRLHTLHEKQRLQHMITKIARWVMLFTLPVFIFIIVFRKVILSYLGPGFADGETALIIICTAQLINISFGPIGNFSVMTGNEKYNIIFSITRILLNVSLNLILTPSLGITGTAIATASCVVFWNIGMFITVKRKTGLTTWIFW